jgi:hypothetical protein
LEPASPALGFHARLRVILLALNLAVAGALVLYDRLVRHGRLADRPAGSGLYPAGPIAVAVSSRHGSPRFRRTVQDWKT